MAIKTVFPTRHFLILWCITAPVVLDSCGFCGRDYGQLCSLSDAPLTKSTTPQDQSTVFEIPGTMIVFQGSTCAQSKKSGTKEILNLEQSLALPAYATKATVFLNGWEVDYLNGDHHVAGLGTLIDTIRIEQNTLKWQAAGILSDDNFDDAYQWCYHFTVIAWNPSRINLFVDHSDGNCFKPKSTPGNFYSTANNSTTTALASFASFIQNPNFVDSKTASILPRGFGFDWSGCNEDHHLLQVAYTVGHPEVFIEAGKSYKKNTGNIIPLSAASASQVGTGFVSWETSTIFKDDDNRRDYSFGEVVSGLSGSDLGVIDPPFSILPFDGDSQGAVSSGGVRTKTFVITNIPYNQAVPVLTGWDLSYLAGDQHVKQAGIWIDKFRYEKNPTQLTGTLTYTVASVLRDEDNWPDFGARHKVTILGFQSSLRKESLLTK